MIPIWLMGVFQITMLAAQLSYLRRTVRRWREADADRAEALRELDNVRRLMDDLLRSRFRMVDVTAMAEAAPPLWSEN